MTDIDAFRAAIETAIRDHIGLPTAWVLNTETIDPGSGEREMHGICGETTSIAHALGLMTYGADLITEDD